MGKKIQKYERRFLLVAKLPLALLTREALHKELCSVALSYVENASAGLEGAEMYSYLYR